MLKELALMIPAIRNLHEERNCYAAAAQRLSEENSHLRIHISELEKSIGSMQKDIAAQLANMGNRFEETSNRRIGDVHRRVDELGAAISEISDLRIHTSELEKSIGGMREDISAQLANVGNRLEDTSNHRIDNVHERMNELGASISAISAEMKSERTERKQAQAALNAKAHSSLMGRGLFIVGHARSGTSILLDALNSSPEIYCLGEANLHISIDRPDFDVWYNRMHVELDNPPTKSTHCPMAGNGWAVIEHLSQRYKLIGEKVAFRQDGLGYDFRRFFDFVLLHFPASYYVCVIRDPVAVAASNLEMFLESRVDPQTLKSVVISQLKTYRLILSLALTLPKVYLLRHEFITQASFDRLGAALGVDLNQASDLYDFSITMQKRELGSVIIEDEALAMNIIAYSRIAACFDPEHLTLLARQKATRLLYDIDADISRLENKGDRVGFGLSVESDA